MRLILAVLTTIMLTMPPSATHSSGAADIPPIGDLEIDWSYPITIDIWVEHYLASYNDARFYDSSTKYRGLLREPGETYPVPYRVGSFTIDSTHGIEPSFDPARLEAREHLGFLWELNNDGWASVIWAHIQQRPLPRLNISRQDSLFPLAVIISLVESGYTPYVDGVSGDDIFSALLENPITE